MLGEAGHGEHPRDRAESEQELVVGKLVDFAVASAQLDRARLGVVAGDRAEPQVGSIEDLAQRRHHVARLQRSRRGLGQKRRVEHEVDVVDQSEPR